MFEDGVKTISVEALRALLADLDYDLRLAPNAAGNLAVFSHDHVYLGYIDLATETVELDLPPKK